MSDRRGGGFQSLGGGGLQEFKSRLGPSALARFEEAEARIAARVALGQPPIPAMKYRCTVCHDQGVFLSATYDPTAGEFPELVTCTFCATGQAAVTQRIERLTGGSGLEDFQTITFDTREPTADQRDAWEIAQLWRDQPDGPSGWLWVFGVPWTGKTTMAKCLGNYWLRQGQAVTYRNEPTLFTEMRDTYERGSDVSYRAYFESIRDAPYLILDDFGKAKSTEWVEEQRFLLTDWRLERGLPTVVTTNLEHEEVERHHPRLAARIWANPACTLCPFPPTAFNEQRRG